MDKDRVKQLVSVGLEIRTSLFSGDLLDITLSQKREAIALDLGLSNFTIQDMQLEKTPESYEVILVGQVKGNDANVKILLTNKQLGLLGERYLTCKWKPGPLEE